MKRTALSSTILIFDLDGTLSDPALGISRSINYALAAYKYPPIAESKVSQLIGPPLDAAFQEITGVSSTELIAGLVAKYRERYADVGYAENSLYRGIPEALESLTNSGCTLGLCTSKRSDFAEKILQMFGLQKHFAFVNGGDIGIHKTQQLQSLLASGVIHPGAKMIGDRAVDINAAKRNGLYSVGVLWGHGTLQELRGAGADSIIAAVSELTQLGNQPSS